MPSRIDSWEQQAKPRSLSSLDSRVGITLKRYRRIAKSELLKFDAMVKRFIWAMDAGGAVKIAVEELAGMPDGSASVGHPRRRHYPIHPAQERKLGHPCLVNGVEARIAGEFFLDESERGDLVWYVNVKSGRYCRDRRPTKKHQENVLGHFRNMIDAEIQFDSFD
jgi:hypothetical protein